MNLIYWLNGLPNSGKTTFTKSLLNVIHLDDYEPGQALASHHLYQDIESLFTQYDTIYVDGLRCNSLSRQIMLRKWHNIHHYYVIGIFVDTDPEICKARNTRYTDDRMEQFIQHFDRPVLEEGYDELWTITNNDFDHPNKQVK